jgi:DNA-binding MarR family transcriptional regulator
MSDFHAMPGHLIRRAHQASTALFAAECGRFDLTSVQFAAMSAIRDTPDLDATRLAALIAFDRSTMGDVLERLEAKGWVVRLASPSDRRVKKLGLSEAGAALLDQVQPAVRRVQERLLAPFPPEEHAAVLQLLRRLSAAV